TARFARADAFAPSISASSSRAAPEHASIASSNESAASLRRFAILPNASLRAIQASHARSALPRAASSFGRAPAFFAACLPFGVDRETGRDGARTRERVVGLARLREELRREEARVRRERPLARRRVVVGAGGALRIAGERAQPAELQLPRARLRDGARGLDRR